MPSWWFIVSYCILTAILVSPLPPRKRADPLSDDEVDSDETRRVLGSSVVTSVSVIMDLGNGSTALISKPSGHNGDSHSDDHDPGSVVNNALSPEKRPVGSPPALLSPDRYEFYTFDESGELVRRLMTLEQIQSLIAGGDDANRLAALSSDIEADTATIMSESDPQGEVVANVQQVLAEELMASIHKNGSEHHETEVEVEAVVQEVPPPSSPKPFQDDVDDFEVFTSEAEESTFSIHDHQDDVMVTDQSSNNSSSNHNVTFPNGILSTEDVEYTSAEGDEEPSTTTTAPTHEHVLHSESAVESSPTQHQDIPGDESTQMPVSTEDNDENSNDLSVDELGVTETTIKLSPSLAETSGLIIGQIHDPASSVHGEEVTSVKITESSSSIETMTSNEVPIATDDGSGQVFDVYQESTPEIPPKENNQPHEEDTGGEDQLMDPPSYSQWSHESASESHETAENHSEKAEELTSDGTTSRPGLDLITESLSQPNITHSDQDTLDDFLSSTIAVPELDAIPSSPILDDFKAPDEADFSDIYYAVPQLPVKNNSSIGVESISEEFPDTIVPEVDPVTEQSFNQVGIQEPSDLLLPPLNEDSENKPTQSDAIQSQGSDSSEDIGTGDDGDEDLLDELAESVSSVLSQVSGLDDDLDENTTKKPAFEPTQAVRNETSPVVSGNDNESLSNSHQPEKIEDMDAIAILMVSPGDDMAPQKTSTATPGNNVGQLTQEGDKTGQKYDDERNESHDPEDEISLTENGSSVSITSTEPILKKDSSSTTEVSIDAITRVNDTPTRFESEYPTQTTDDTNKLSPNVGGESNESETSPFDVSSGTEMSEQEKDTPENEELVRIKEAVVPKTTERTQNIEHDSENTQDTSPESHDSTSALASTEADKEMTSEDAVESQSLDHTANEALNDYSITEEESMLTTISPFLFELETIGTEKTAVMEKGTTESSVSDSATIGETKIEDSTAESEMEETPIGVAISGANEQHGNKVGTRPTMQPLPQDPEDEILLNEMHKVAEEESDPLLSAHDLEGLETTSPQSSVKGDPMEISDNGESSLVDDKDFSDHETSFSVSSSGAHHFPSPNKASDPKPTPPGDNKTPLASDSSPEEGNLPTEPIASDDQSMELHIQAQKNISLPISAHVTTMDAFKPTTIRPAHHPHSTSTDNDIQTAFTPDSPVDFPAPDGLDDVNQDQALTNSPVDELLISTTEDSSTTTVTATTTVMSVGNSAGSIVPPLMPTFPPAPSGNVGLEGTSSSLDPDVKRFVDLCNDLALLLYSEVTRAAHSVPMTRGTHGGGLQTRSLVLSPFAITSLLSMVFLGARGPTSEQMNDLLRLDDMITFNPHLVLQNVTESVITSPGVSAAAFVRELYSDKANGKLLEFYKARAKAFYEGHVEEVDFKDVNDVLRRRTNHLVRWQTRGRVPEYLRGSSLKLRSPLAALSANFFEADCQRASSTGTDGEMYFEVPAMGRRRRRLVPIPAVVWRGVFLAGYDLGLDATVLELRHGGGEVSTVLVLPGRHGQSVESDDITGGLSRLEEWLTKGGKESWSTLLHSTLPRGPMEVQLPRFAHRSVVNVTGALSRMGLHDLFTHGKADLRGLDGGLGGKLHLADMIQMTAFGVCADDGASKRHLETYPSAQRTGRTAEDTIEKKSSEFQEESVTDEANSRRGKAEWSDELEREEDNSYVFAAAAAARELPLALRPRQARIPKPLPESRVVLPRLRFDRPFLYFVRHNPSGFILLMGRFNPRLFP